MKNIDIVVTVECPPKKKFLAFLRANGYKFKSVIGFVNSLDTLSVWEKDNNFVRLPRNADFTNPEFYLQNAIEQIAFIECMTDIAAYEAIKKS